MAGNDKLERFGTESEDTACRARVIRAMLDQIVERIADSDHRQSIALRDMQERLGALGARTLAAKTQLPDRYAGAFERVETAMEALAGRLAEAEIEQRRHAADPEVAAPTVLAAAATAAPRIAPSKAPAALSQFSDSTETISETVTAEVRRAMTGTHAAAAAPPPALKSAVAAAARPGDWIRVEPPRAASPSHPSEGLARSNLVDEDLGPADLDSHWQEGVAEDLARHYEGATSVAPVAARSAVPNPQDLRHDAMMTPAQHVDTPKPFVAPLAAAMTAPLAAAPAPQIERAWLEARLADVAKRVEESLTGINPHNSFLALGERFDQLERRFGSALDDVATRADIEGLRGVENQLSELFSQLDQTQAQLGRLDAIETQLGTLARALSDEQLVRLIGELVPTEQELTTVAEVAAERVAERFYSQAPAHPGEPSHAMAQSQDDPRIGEMAMLLQDFMTERRDGEAQTAEALDTLQQAMQHLLDRIDSIEAGQNAGGLAAPQPAAAPPQQPPAANPDRWRSSLPRDAAPGHEPACDDGEARHHVSPGDQARAAARAAASRMGGREPSPATTVGEGGPAFETVYPGPRATVTGRSKPAEQDIGEGSPVDTDRKAFIAMARKAAERASEVPAMQAEAPAKPGLRERLKLGDKDGSSGFGARPRMLLVAGIAAFLLAGYWMMAGPRLGGSPPSASISRKAAPPKAAPNVVAPGTADPASETEPPAAPANGGSPDGTAPRSRSEAPGGPEAEALPGDTPAGPGRNLTTGHVFQDGVGIAVDDSQSAPAPDALDRARQQVQMANLSTRLGQDLGRQSLATETAAARDLMAAAARTGSEPRAAPPGAARAVELPPATVGPLSLRQAAAKGDPVAQLEVASRLAEGRGIPQDFAQAATWYQRSATQGNAGAQYRLAALYERGLGVTADPARARLWYKRAAEQGNVRAMHNLAVLSAGRAGSSPDYLTAVQWFTEAADRGLADSQYNLGILYESGLGVPANRIEAYKWFSLAGRSGDKEAQRRRDKIRKELDAKTLSAADSLVLSWRSKPVQMGPGDRGQAGQVWKLRVDAAQQ